MKFDKESVIQILTKIIHPEKKQDIVALGMIEKIAIDNNKIDVDMRLQRLNDPFSTALRRNSIAMLKSFYGESVEVTITMLQPEKKEQDTVNALAKIKNIIVVSSGKGGVGKSTIAANLAVATAKTGASVGLLDADIYGPSGPIMFGLKNEKPLVEEEGSKQWIIPILKHGVKVQSIGFFIDADNPLIWRGPMVNSALKQLIHQTRWGELDYLYIDMPPGTGDIHISIVQEMSVTGAVIVSTPQQVAIADVIKGIGMYRSANVDVPVLGIIENMSWFTPEELPNNKYYIFGQEGCQSVCNKFNIPLLGQIPIVQSVCADSDAGNPSALNQLSIQGKAFQDLAEKVMHAVKIRNEELPPTQRVEMKKK